MTRGRKPKVEPGKPAQRPERQPPSAREAWDDLLASLPLSDDQRRALTAAADDLAIDAAEGVADAVSKAASDVGNAALAGCHGIVTLARQTKDARIREARDRQRVRT